MKKLNLDTSEMLRLRSEGNSYAMIAKTMGVSYGTVQRRFLQLQEADASAGAIECNISLYATLAKSGRRYCVTKIGNTNFTIKDIDRTKPPEIVVDKLAYLRGSTGYKKVNASPVKVYYKQN